MRSSPNVSPAFRLWHWQTGVLLAIFFGIRAASFFLVPFHAVHLSFALLLLCAFVWVNIARPQYAFIILCAELLLGASGQLFEIGTLSLRTLFVITFVAIWFVRVLIHKQYTSVTANRRLFFLISAILLFVFVSSLLGIVHGHSVIAVVQDALPFLYLVLVFPALSFLSKLKPTDHELLMRLLVVFIAGSALWSLLLFLIFSNGWAAIHQPFYNWIRDVGLGKVTDLNTGFFRIVFPEHLLLTTLLLVITSARIHLDRYRGFLLAMLLLISIPLLLNFSRAYLLGTAVGILILGYKAPIRRWIKESAIVGLLLVSVFAGLNLIGSHGKSIGLEALGLRFGGVVRPQTEESAATRSLLLKPIFQLIQKNPILGDGLGAGITFWNPYLGLYTTTRHFDWGYLELWTELGMVGGGVFLWYTGWLALQLKKNLPQYGTFLFAGLLSALTALFVIHLFTPALFHIFGVLQLVYITLLLQQKHSTS